MKEYRINENLIEYLLSKGVIISNKEDALKKIEDEVEKSPEIDSIINFIRNSERGIIK